MKKVAIVCAAIPASAAVAVAAGIYLSLVALAPFVYAWSVRITQDYALFMLGQ